MSAYMYFFVRKNEFFLPIYTTSRSSMIYNAFGFGLWERVAPITGTEIKAAREELTSTLKVIDDELEGIENDLLKVPTFQNSADEKLEALSSLRYNRKEFRVQRVEVIYALNFCAFLESILSEAEDSKYYENENLKLDPNHYLYYGIECGVDIKPDMIQEN